MCSKAPVNASALRQPGFREAAFQVAALRAQSHVKHYARSFRTRLPDRTVADGERFARACRVSISPRGQLGLSVPLRWRPAHGGSYSNECNARACRARNHVRLEPVQGATHRCNQEPKSFESRSPKRSFEAVLHVWSRRLQGKQYSSCSRSRLTLPSRGQLPGYALQLPLMSNVRRLTQVLGAYAKASPRFASRAPGRLRSPSLRLEANHTSSTTHALAEPDCQIGRSPRTSMVQARQVATHTQGRFGLSVPLRWRPARGCSGSRTLNGSAWRVQIHVRFEQVQCAELQCNQELRSSSGTSVKLSFRAAFGAALPRL